MCVANPARQLIEHRLAAGDRADLGGPSGSERLGDRLVGVGFDRRRRGIGDRDAGARELAVAGGPQRPPDRRHIVLIFGRETEIY